MGLDNYSCACLTTWGAVLAVVEDPKTLKRPESTVWITDPNAVDVGMDISLRSEVVLLWRVKEYKKPKFCCQCKHCIIYSNEALDEYGNRKYADTMVCKHIKRWESLEDSTIANTIHPDMIPSPSWCPLK